MIPKSFGLLSISFIFSNSAEPKLHHKFYQKSNFFFWFRLNYLNFFSWKTRTPQSSRTISFWIIDLVHRVSVAIDRWRERNTCDSHVNVKNKKLKSFFPITKFSMYIRWLYHGPVPDDNTRSLNPFLGKARVWFAIVASSHNIFGLIQLTSMVLAILYFVVDQHRLLWWQ